MITPLGIKAKLAEAKKSGKDKFISDDSGQRHGWRLLLRCWPSGSATWIFRYTLEGKRHQILLGESSSMDIQAARAAATEYAAIYQVTPDIKEKLKNEELARQNDLQQEKDKSDLIGNEQRRKQTYTLSKMMSVYVSYLRKQEKLITARDVESLSKHLSTLGAKPAADVTKKDFVAIQRTLLEVGKGRTANKLRSFVRAAYSLVLRADSDATAPSDALDFATEGGVESNPAALVAVAKGFNGTSDRVLTNEELFSFLDRAKNDGVQGLSARSAVLLGGQRMSQLLRSKVTDVQDDFLVLLDPKGKRDEPRRHPIPLEGDAGEVVQEAVDRAASLKSTWLFSSSGEVPVSVCTVSIYVTSISNEFLESGISKIPFTMSDLRRTVETRLAGLGVSKEIRGHLQSHGLSGVQVRHYDRHDYEHEKRSALKVFHRWINSKGKSKPRVGARKQI